MAGASVPGGWLPREQQQPQWGGEDHMSAVHIDLWESLFPLTLWEGGWSQRQSFGTQEKHSRGSRHLSHLWGECQRGP